MKIKIDRRVLVDMLPGIAATNKGATAGRISGDINLGTTAAARAINPTTVLDYIVDAGVVLDEANCPESDRFLVIPAKMAGVIKQSDLKDASLTGDSESVLRNGRLGRIDRFTVYTSHNLMQTSGKYHIIAGHKSGLTFASQMTKMETLRAQTTFGNIIRGLQVYGYKVVKPEALVEGVVAVA
jgi:hypothetical protein